MMVLNRRKKVGLLRECACRWHQSSFAPNGEFGTSRFEGTKFYAT